MAARYGRADAAKLLQPRTAPTAAGAEAIRQAEREGLTLATSSNSNSGYKGVTFKPKKQGSKKYELAAVRQAGREGLALASSSSSKSGYKGVAFYPKARGRKKYKLQEMEVEAGAAARVAPAPAAEERRECAICLDGLSSHPEARLQPRDPNGWGATHCCKSLFHYRCLHTWLSDDSEVETSRGMEPINTACPGCRGFVSNRFKLVLFARKKVWCQCAPVPCPVLCEYR
ncbi:hypothetical protein EMIHUDRAFT_242732 [Emiliania huxleyi CCMP1516]|uniref:RING-type domain-containing protein n=2 Tax=Emiliania huxleyi TaxID=2903 RepID=A0A0D3J852_EMIH1|nr:hypothetical protein EMIHUDRAFT_242732 [Emiliania huxleyi CCMP1516]EOD19687.1 hypothetical protein EMIHUDRAFT_242732 [Emiliania huxleyi CCMP1516]|eukprot:XP_005772116.1 hypothetical protein EMIHUDRAFT_242732 [Emiliania huxleyi CCMP1516]